MPPPALTKAIPSIEGGAGRGLLTPALARLKLIYWKRLEEHPSVPKRILALDSRGWLSVGSLKSTVSE